MEAKKERFALHLIIYLALVFFFSLLPPIGTITPEGMRLTGLFIAFIYGLTVTTDVWPALLTLVLFPFTGLLTFGGVLGASFGNDVCIFVMLSLVLVAYMEYSGAAAQTPRLNRPSLAAALHAALYLLAAVQFCQCHCRHDAHLGLSL